MVRFPALATALFITAMVPLCAQPPCTATDALHSGHYGLSGQDGIFFDIDANTTVTIECFEGYFTTGGQNRTNVYIWTKNGTHIGAETDPTQWVLIDSIINFQVGPTQSTLLHIPIDVDVTIPAGGTAGFYVTNGDLPGMTNTGIRYDPSNTGLGTVTASDANITIREGAGSYDRWVIFAGSRTFSGQVHYTSTSTGSAGLAHPVSPVLLPNPAGDRCVLERGGLTGALDIRLMDALGRTVSSWRSAEQGPIVIPVQGLDNGLFFVQVSSSTTTHTLRLVKDQ